MNKNDFLKSWDNLVGIVENLTKVADTNRRLLAGITKIMLEKELLTPEDVRKLENDVSSVLGQKYPKKKRLRKKIST